MDLPLIIGGEKRGLLRVTQSGLYTVIEAELDGGAGTLVRLWAHGGGRSAYLGVMQPRGAGLWLRRRLSRNELRAFPDPIESASDRETESPQAAGPEPARESRDAAGDAEETPARESDHRSCPWPAEPPEEGLLWYRRPDGSLTAFDGISSLLALPAELRAPGPQASLRVIEGKKYLVFRY